METLRNLHIGEYFLFIARKTIRSYFFFLFSRENRPNADGLYSEFLIVKNGFIKNKEDYISFSRDLACENQSMISNYWKLGSDTHKELRLAFDSSDKVGGSIKALYSNLINNLNKELFKSTEINFTYLHRYFYGRSQKPPRICIKGYFQSAKEGEVITVFRDSYSDEDHSTGEGSNTGFDSVINTGKFYLCNDLPKASFNEEYINPRLDPRKLSTKAKPLSYIFRDLLWNRSWKGGNDESKYKSTLIVPMTFWNNNDDDALSKSLQALPESKRTIFGFLCVDHVEKNYFNKESDVSMSYIAADYIAMILYARSNFLEMSGTVSAVESLLKGKKDAPDYSQLFDELNRSISSKSKSQLNTVSDIKVSSKIENKVWEFDSELFDFASELKQRKGYIRRH